MSAAADALVARLPRTTLVVGKGGVGKTTVAAALALHSSRRAGRTLVLTTDPARALPDVLGHPVGTHAAAVTWVEGLDARLLDAAPLRAAFMERWGSVLRMILDRGTYLDDADIAPLVDTAMPGSDEIFAALALADLLAADGPGARWERIVVDTAPTGHTLRLLELPRTFRALVRLLDAMQGKHRTMVRALTRTYRRDAADAFLAEMEARVSTLEQAMRDPARCAAVMVAQPPLLVREETVRFLGALETLHLHVTAVVWNATDSPVEPVGAMPQLRVRRLATPPVGRRGLEEWLGALEALDATAHTPAEPVPPAAGAGHQAPELLKALLHPLTVVAGKGGVGKTTVAAGLAIRSAASARTLVVSTDPAPSLGDALAQPIGDADTPVIGVPGLFARQMDATAAFSRLRTEYQSRVDALFEGLVGRGVDLAPDRAIMRDLLALAPPGVDEVYALSRIADALFADRFERVIVDPAPTGHLLRLLEMPALALSWTHQLMRIVLKYRDVAGLGEAAADLLAFARDLRGLDGLLRDPARAGMVLVTLDEPVVAAETTRLARDAASTGLSLAGVVHNRSGGAATLSAVPDAPLHFDAPLASPPPVGAPALDAWIATWREAERAT